MNRSSASRPCWPAPNSARPSSGIREWMTPPSSWLTSGAAGNYGAEEDRTRRLARPLCFLRSDPTDNGYVRPIGAAPGRRSEHHAGDPGRGVRPCWPLPPGEANYAADRVGRLHACIKPRDQPRRRGRASRWKATRSSMAEVELRHRLQCAEGLNACRSSWRYHDVSGRDRSILYRALADRDGGPATVIPERPSGGRYGLMSASTAWAQCADSLDAGLRLPGPDPLLRRSPLCD